MYFPREGSKETPPHPSGNFTFKDYMPMAFRKLRQIFAIDAGDYMMSICGACRATSPLLFDVYERSTPRQTL